MYDRHAFLQVGRPDALRVEVGDTVKYTHDSGIRLGLVFMKRIGSDGSQECVVWPHPPGGDARGQAAAEGGEQGGEHLLKMFAWPGSQFSQEGGVHLPADDAEACR